MLFKHGIEITLPAKAWLNWLRKGAYMWPVGKLNNKILVFLLQAGNSQNPEIRKHSEV